VHAEDSKKHPCTKWRLGLDGQLPLASRTISWDSAQVRRSLLCRESLAQSHLLCGVIWANLSAKWAATEAILGQPRCCRAGASSAWASTQGGQLRYRSGKLTYCSRMMSMMHWQCSLCLDP